MRDVRAHGGSNPVEEIEICRREIEDLM